MAHMVYQQYTTAVLDGYRGRPDAAERLAEARAYREWLESLELESRVKATLVEQARVVEEAFAQAAGF